MRKKIFLQCTSQVDKSAITRETIDGVEHIIISSFTLPDDIVMNGGFYAAKEIEQSFHTLERTLAPIEHPVDSNGNFLSASDPIAINNFYAGAYNTNVVRENGRVRIDKTVNVQEALKSDRGKHLLSRINEIEESSNPRPIHTSVGVFLEVEEHDSPMVNAAGQEYTWSAHEMVFDHDAILLNSVGAAQPDQGVGMAINADGTKIETQTFILNQEGDQSFDEREQSVRDALERQAIRFDWIEQMFPDHVIFYVGDIFFTVPYIVDDIGRATIVGLPMPVDREVTFNPKTNSEGDAMKELMMNALKEAGIETKDLSDDELFAAYNQHLQANQSSSDDGDQDNDGLAEVVANAVTEALKPVTEELNRLKDQINNSSAEELESLAKTVSESGLYPGLDLETCKKLGVNKLTEMAASCPSSHGIPLTLVNADSNKPAEYAIPE